MESDLKLNLVPFEPEQVDPEITALKQALDERSKLDTKWWECGAEIYRQRRAAGKTPFPPGPVLRTATTTSFSSPLGHEILLRIFGAGLNQPRGIYYHIHGGAYVLGSAASQDLLLDSISTRGHLVVVSLDYRLAPEHVFPAPQEDCYAAAEWLLSQGFQRWNCQVRFIGGESAGATLAALVLLYLRRTHPDHSIIGTVLNYGNFDLSMLPSIRDQNPATSTLLSWDECEHFSEASLPGWTMEERKRGDLSPAYNDLRNLRSAIFVVGTADGVVDDTLLMASKWMLAGNEAIVKFIPGACHGFMTFDPRKVSVTRAGLDLILQYIKQRLDSAEMLEEPMVQPCKR